MVQIRLFSFVLIVACFSVLSPTYSAAQTCEIGFDNALRRSFDLCDGLTRNQACYGEERVVATLAAGAPASAVFEKPSDMLDVAFIGSLSTSGPDSGEETAGVAVLKIQANFPATLPGQSVIMVLVGDTRITNDAELNTPPVDPLPVTVTLSANLRSGPSTSTAVMTGAAPGDELLVDGRNAAGDWLRVVDGENTYWIFASLVQTDADLSALPDLSGAAAPMQAFYIEGGVGLGGCNRILNAVLLQTPRGQNMTMSINGSSVVIGSTVLVEREADRLRLSVLDGSAVVLGGVTAIEGQQFDTELNANGDVTAWGRLRPMDDDQIERYRALEAVADSSIFHYPFRVPDAVAIEQLVSGDSPTVSELCVDVNGNIADGSGTVVQFGGGAQLTVSDAGRVIVAGNGVFGPYCDPQNTVSSSSGGGQQGASPSSSGGGQQNASPSSSDGGQQNASPSSPDGGQQNASPSSSGGGQQGTSPSSPGGGQQNASPSSSGNNINVSAQAQNNNNNNDDDDDDGGGDDDDDDSGGDDDDDDGGNDDDD